MFYLQLNEGMGSDNQVIIRDLKTIRGVTNRIRKGYYKAGQWKLYSFTDIYNDDTYIYIGIISK